ncbi:diacylglycerol kinase family protein [Sphingomonas sp.]|uniref:diacylglycerol/lipid kinase family protein n=1 Tax=Sphingomonas sp. TaxID=28214 RepID=UPI0025CD549A|nr:diacylglycerol kinase family protein [Sphingomonas sp.]MBV9527991.1 diacylglycerol kinase family lipid kinase [Sphingomonas sp.]
MSVSVLLNRGGGTIAANPKIPEQVEAALKAAGIDAKIELIDGGDCEVRAKAIADRGDELVIVGGGDGSISAAASALVGSKTRLGVLPLGTLNHFARDLGIPTEIEDAAKLIATGHERRVDVAEMNGRIFINNSAIGLYPLMVRDRDVQQKRHGRSKRLAMIVASARTLARFNHERLTLTVNDEKARVDTPLLFVGNNDYRLDIAAPGQRESLDDGELSVFVMRKKTRRGLIAASVRALFNRARGDDMVMLDNVQRLRVESRRSQLAVSLDGEVVRAEPPLDYRIRKAALRVIAPPPEARQA